VLTFVHYLSSRSFSRQTTTNECGLVVPNERIFGQYAG